MITVETVRAYFEERHEWMDGLLRRRFPHLTVRGDPEALTEAVQNTLALAFENVSRCAAKGKIPDEDMLLRYTKQSLWWAVRHTCAGRSITRKPNAEKKFGDVYEQMARHNTGLDLRAYIGRETPVPEAVCFRVDFPAFFTTLTGRQRDMAMDLISGAATSEVAAKFGVTPGAISQFRTRFHLLWRRFNDES
jgi:hypothetical protein